MKIKINYPNIRVLFYKIIHSSIKLGATNDIFKLFTYDGMENLTFKFGANTYKITIEILPTVDTESTE